MKLLTKEIIDRVPALYAQEELGSEAIIHAKFFDPCGSWSWYMTELNPDTLVAFGLVDGFERELGYFSILELEGIKNRLGIGIERDIDFAPKRLGDLASRG